ncbi:MAG: hypothetical protein K8T89_19390 [Planctomycetes bacterium]|nr:hypothetical protein [Planctomycetota bacterium]
MPRQLANPPREKRLGQARAEVAKLRQEQDALARLEEQTAKPFEKLDPTNPATQKQFADKAADLAKRQGQALDRLSKLDTPGLEDRLEKTAEAMKLAKSDLEKGRAPDAAASQQAARRELERLEQALNGQTPADEQVDKLAKKQRDLADAMANNAKSPQPRTRELQQQQAELTKELQKLSAPEAPASKEDAMELSRATENARSADEAAKRGDETANALQKLADQINGRAPEIEKADRLAKRQKEQADEADYLAKKKQPHSDQRRKSQQIFDELRNLRPGEESQREKQKAIETLTRAQQTTQPDQLVKAEREAAETLERLSEKMKQNPPPERPLAKKKSNEGLQGLPTQELADEARKLADEQRKLRDELARSNEQMARDQKPLDKNPLEELIKEEEKIARETGELAKSIAPEKGEKPESQKAQVAAEAAKQATGQMKNGQIDLARESGGQTAQRLEQLGQSDLAEKPRKQAADLARRQEEVNKKLEQLTGSGAASQAQQAERQKELQQQLEELTQKMQKLAKDMKKSEGDGKGGDGKGMGEGEGKADDAARQAMKAEESMKLSRDQNARNQKEMARESQEKAADALREAGKDLKDAAKQMAFKQGDAEKGKNPGAGQAVQEARDGMERARGELGKGKPGSARDSMQKSAESLRKAIEKMIRSNAKSGDNDGSPMGKVDAKQLEDLAGKYKGKAWGDLPGEIKNQIISDMKARYGEEYSRYIKLYFEQLAERK